MLFLKLLKILYYQVESPKDYNVEDFYIHTLIFYFI